MATPTSEEIFREVLECARYGELDELKEFVETYNVDVTQADSLGSTALHRACANGHLSVVSYLLDKGCKNVSNHEGNTPLHWAVQNKQLDVVKELCARCEGIDVLAQNASGKSAISFGVAAQDPKIYEALLVHSSAKPLEDYGKSSKNSNGDNESESFSMGDVSNAVPDATAAPGKPGFNDDDIQYKEHEMAFGNGPVVRVREMGFTPQHLEALSDLSLDTTGATLWGASLVLARWIIDLADELQGSTMLEVGAGCALPGVVAHHYVKDSNVVITDLDSKTFTNTVHNADINRRCASEKLEAVPLDWANQSTWPAHLVGKVDVIFGSDLLFDRTLVAPLLDTVLGMLKPGGSFLFVTADTSRAGREEFVKAMEDSGFDITVSSPPMERYSENPLTNGDQTQFELSFSLADDNFLMYRMQRPTEAGIAKQ